MKGKIKLSKGYNKYGAYMGRMNKEVTGKCYLQEVSINQGGYDKGGAYWGIGGEKLFVAEDRVGNQFFVRATNRNSAKSKVRFYNNNVTFYK